MSHWIAEATELSLSDNWGFLSHLKSISQVCVPSLSSYSSTITSVSNVESSTMQNGWKFFSILYFRYKVKIWSLIHIVGFYCASLTQHCQILNPVNVADRSTFFHAGPMSSLFMLMLLPDVFPICLYLSSSQGQVWEN